MDNSKKRKLYFYLTLLFLFICVLTFIFLNQGNITPAEPKTSEGSIIDSFLKQLADNSHHKLSLLILQIGVIVIFARGFGYLFKKFNQPAVIGEITAGIVLGPSILGMFFPGVFSYIFPDESLVYLQLLSQIGLIVYMFVIGMDLDIHLIRKDMSSAVLISHASIIIPYLLGIILSYYIYKDFSPPGISFLSFALFMGIAMSITAFPVLVRIIKERKMENTHIGVLTITCAASDDVTAWCILAVVVAIVKAGGITGAIFTIVLALAYVVFMLLFIKPFLKKLDEKYFSKKNPNTGIIALTMLLMLFSAFLSEVIGIHAIFGAFLAGIVMPQNKPFKKLIAQKIETISLVLLIPVFFVVTGLKTEIGLLNSGYLWFVCIAILLVAVAGKLGGSALTAKFIGLSWKNALTIGILMNTRGLMELIVLNVGYDEGILTKEIFSMMVIMALVTTFMAGPALGLIRNSAE
ncbi:MAG: cation:proton antiporter [Cytophagaceae bacterium]